jgi:hypothetical protein
LVVLCPGCQQVADVDDIDGKVPFRSECPRCSVDLHVCLTCQHHDKQAHNQCREPTADPVGQKDRRNLCDDHRPRPHGSGPTDTDHAKARLATAFGAPLPSAAPLSSPQPLDAAAEAKRKLDALFGKK